MAKGRKPKKVSKGRGNYKPSTKPMTRSALPNTYKAGVVSPYYTYRFRFSGGTLG